MKKKRHDMLYKRDDDKQVKKLIELEKRVLMSEDDSSSKNESNDIDEGNDSAYSNIKNKKSETFKFKKPTKNNLIGQQLNGVNRNSLSGASSSSFLETDKERNSMHIFTPAPRLGSAEPSEIARNINAGDSDLTSIKNAFLQVSSIIEAHNFRFNKARRPGSIDINEDKKTYEDNRYFIKS